MSLKKKMNRKLFLYKKMLLETLPQWPRLPYSTKHNIECSCQGVFSCLQWNPESVNIIMRAWVSSLSSKNMKIESGADWISIIMSYSWIFMTTFNLECFDFRWLATWSTLSYVVVSWWKKLPFQNMLSIEKQRHKRCTRCRLEIN